jgi:hypothetical protein
MTPLKQPPVIAYYPTTPLFITGLKQKASQLLKNNYIHLFGNTPYYFNAIHPVVLYKYRLLAVNRLLMANNLYLYNMPYCFSLYFLWYISAQIKVLCKMAEICITWRVYTRFLWQWHNTWKMYNIKIRNCGLLSYGTVQYKWSAQTVWPGPTAPIIWWPV